MCSRHQGQSSSGLGGAIQQSSLRLEKKVLNFQQVPPWRGLIRLGDAVTVSPDGSLQGAPYAFSCIGQCGSVITLDTKPVRLPPRGWPKYLCRMCDKFYRCSAGTCALCSTPVSECACRVIGVPMLIGGGSLGFRTSSSLDPCGTSREGRVSAEPLNTHTQAMMLWRGLEMQQDARCIELSSLE